MQTSHAQCVRQLSLRHSLSIRREVHGITCSSFATFETRQHQNPAVRAIEVVLHKLQGRKHASKAVVQEPANLVRHGKPKMK